MTEDKITPEQRQFLLRRWRVDARLRRRYGGDFAAYLAGIVAESEKVANEPIVEIPPQHRF